jgi:N-carbamoyl-L-amino-acid hydrolase
MLALADVVTTARHSAHHHGCVATIGKVTLTPNAVNAIPSRVTAWLDARGPDEDSVRAVVSDVSAAGGGALEESWTTDTAFDANLRDRVQRVLGGVPILTTGAGHDAGILAAAGVPTAMLFVRNPTGVSHSPAEYAERADCLAGVDALREVIADLAGPDRP